MHEKPQPFPWDAEVTRNMVKVEDAVCGACRAVRAQADDAVKCIPAVPPRGISAEMGRTVLQTTAGPMCL